MSGAQRSQLQNLYEAIESLQQVIQADVVPGQMTMHRDSVQQYDELLARAEAVEPGLLVPFPDPRFEWSEVYWAQPILANMAINRATLRACPVMARRPRAVGRVSAGSGRERDA
jgi:hypothetical protein